MAVEHNTLPSEAQHIIHRWKAADETALNAIVPTLADVDKIALREDNDTFYRLKSHDPIVWVEVGSSETVDLSNYYTKPETDALIPTIPEFKTINGETITGTGDIVVSGGTTDLTNYYTKTEVDTLISSIDYSSYYTKTEVDTLIANLPQTDLSGYYTKSEVDTLIAGIETGTVDLSNYYTKSETYNKTEIDTAIASVTPAELTNNLSHITQIKMTQQEGSIYKYTPPLTTWFTLPFNYASIDDLLQFDSATHTITAKKTGYYIINMSVVHLQTTTDGASAWTRYALVDGSFDTSLTTPTYGNSHYYSQTFSSEPVGLQETISLYLTIGQSIKIVMYTGHSTAYIGTNNETDTFYSTYINMYMLSGVGVVNEGLNAYELAVQEGFVGTLTDWLNSLKGDDGTNGADGVDGTDGLSAYQVWLNLGNTGTEQDFINSLKGDTGATGADGTDGVGVPTGGTTGQILAKVDNTDYNTKWIDAPTGGGSAEYPDQTGNSGKFLSTDGTNVLWDDIPQPIFNGLSELPQYQLNTEALTSERWHNGKPIYQKVIDFGTLPNATSKSVAHGITNADVMWLDRGSSMVYVTGTPTTAYGLEFGTNTDIDVHAWSTDVNNTTVRMYTYSNRTTFSAYMTIKYTKSTDTSNSPVALVGNEPPLIFSAITNQLAASGALTLSNILIDTHSISTSATQITIPTDGIYELHIHGNIDQIGQLGIQVNGVTQTNGYENDDRAQVSCTIIRNLVANDIVSFMFTEISSTGAMLSPADVYIKKIDTASGNVGNGRYNISSTEYILPYTRNGKTVYGIEIDCGNMPNNTTKNVAIPNYNNAYDYDIVKFKASDLTYHVNVPIQWSATTYIERWITRASGSLTIVSNFNASSLTGKAVLEYTKN